MNFQSKQSRDEAAADYIGRGCSVRRGSQRNVILSPDYVVDYEGTPSPNGFGGSAPEMFSTIYTLDLTDTLALR